MRINDTISPSSIVMLGNGGVTALGGVKVLTRSPRLV